MKIRRHRTCFLVKYFEIPQTPTCVFVRVKSESYKIIGHSCAVLSSTDCCLYTCRHPSSLFTVFAEKKKITRVQALPGIAFWTHQRQRDKAKCKDKIVCRRLSGKSTQSFEFSFVDQACKDTTQKIDLNMIQRTKCSQEDKVWLIVIVF